MAGCQTMDEESTEWSPLLGCEEEAARRPRRYRTTSLAMSLLEFYLTKTHDPSTILAMMCAIILISSSSGGLYMIPLTRVFENRLCRQYYDRIQTTASEPIDEELCKADAVQSKLSFLFATHSAIEAVLGCLVAMPWGFVADRIGRRPVLALVLIGMGIGQLWAMAVGWFHDAFPIQLYWLAPIGTLVGGGNAVATAVMASMLSDVLPESDRAIGLMRVHVSSMVGNLCSPAVASFLMPRIGPWPLICVSEVFLTLPVLAIPLLPETLQHNKADAEAGQLEGFRARLFRSYGGLKDSLSFLEGGSVLLLTLCFLTIMPVLSSTLVFLVQFVSKRYHTNIAYTGYIQTVFGVAQILLVLIIPYLSSYITRPTCPSAIRIADERQRDLGFARWSFVALTLGALVMAISPALPGFVGGLLIMALGTGASSYLSSTLAFYVDQEHRTRVFSVISIVNIAGSVYAMPALAGLFTLGMRLGGAWVSLPYLGISVLCMTAIVLLLFVRLPKLVEPEDCSAHGGSSSSSSNSSDTAVEDW